MEAADRELLLSVIEKDIKLKRLYLEHQKFEEHLAGLQHRPFLTAGDERREVELKRKKLAGVDQIMQLLAPYRNAA